MISIKASGLDPVNDYKQVKALDVLEDDELRSSIKIYSDWPTIPQVYLKGEFIGGSDLLMDLYQERKVKEMLKEAGVKLDE